MERDGGCGEPGGASGRGSRRLPGDDGARLYDDEVDPEPEVELLLLDPDEPEDEPDDEPEDDFEPDPESEDPELLDPPEPPESEDDEPESDPAAARLSVR